MMTLLRLVRRFPQGKAARNVIRTVTGACTDRRVQVVHCSAPAGVDLQHAPRAIVLCQGHNNCGRLWPAIHAAFVDAGLTDAAGHPQRHKRKLSKEDKQEKRKKRKKSSEKDSAQLLSTEEQESKKSTEVAEEGAANEDPGQEDKPQKKEKGDKKEKKKKKKKEKREEKEKEKKKKSETSKA